MNPLQSLNFTPGEKVPGNKWYRTRKCGCGECRFHPIRECTLEASRSAIWLWAMDPDYIGLRDHIDPFEPLNDSMDSEEVEELIEESSKYD